MRIEAVVFDMDGLMLDTEPIYKAAWQQAAAQLMYEIDDPFYSTLIGRQTEDCERVLLRRFGTDFPLDLFRSLWPKLWKAEAGTGIAMKAGLPEILAFLKDHNMATAVATSSDAEYTTFTLQRAGLDKRFEIVVTGDQVARGKPAPDIYVEAARRLGVEPARCMALEDSEVGVRAAHGAGMMGILIPDLAPPTEAAIDAAYEVLESLHEAHHLLTTIVAKQSGG